MNDFSTGFLVALLIGLVIWAIVLAVKLSRLKRFIQIKNAAMISDIKVWLAKAPQKPLSSRLLTGDIWPNVPHYAAHAAGREEAAKLIQKIRGAAASNFEGCHDTKWPEEPLCVREQVRKQKHAQA